MARIQYIKSFTAPKPRNRCPSCATTSIKDRKQKSPVWRCSDGHEFDDPVVDNEEVNAYEADYGNTFLPLDSTFSVQHLKDAALRPNDQLSIEEIDVAPLAERTVSAGPEARDLLTSFLQARCPSPEGYSPSEQPTIRDPGTAYTPGMADTRERINRSVALRRGQKPFRNRLIRRYRPACMVSGCELMEIVEAAHIWPYRGKDDNHPENGLLLRADLHTLFDVNLLGIDPQGLTVHLHPDAKSSGYSEFDQTPLRIAAQLRPSTDALESRWKSYRERLKRQ